MNQIYFLFFDFRLLVLLAISIGQGRATVMRSVGAYELEGHGAWLFEKVDGDFFTILENNPHAR